MAKKLVFKLINFIKKINFQLNFSYYRRKNENKKKQMTEKRKRNERG